MKAAGKGVIGMKILGAGALRHKADESLQFALSLDCVDCFHDRRGEPRGDGGFDAGRSQRPA